MYFKNLPNVSKNLPNVSKNLTHIYVIVRMYPSRNTLFGKKKRNIVKSRAFLYAIKNHDKSEKVTLLLVRQALYLAAILTEQKRSTVINRTVNCETKHTV